MNFWIGTSGFQYPEWKGTFYPEDLPASQMLPFYAERLTTTEINYTFRRIPSAKTIENWCKLTPEKFKFALKAPQKITHFAKLRGCDDTLTYFYKIVSALGARLGPVLFQLPPFLRKDTTLLNDFVRCFPHEMRAAFEFRHESWFDDEIFGVLREHNVALCLAESEKLSTPVVGTAKFGYLRLRREDYTSDDVLRWTEVVKGKSNEWSDAFVYFKHEEAGIGPKLAGEMLKLVSQSDFAAAS